MGPSEGGRPDGGGGAPRRLRPRELLDVLRRHQVEFVIIGSFALAPHGYVRATQDIDIVPQPGPENLGRLATALRELNACLRPSTSGLPKSLINKKMPLQPCNQVGIQHPKLLCVSPMPNEHSPQQKLPCKTRRQRCSHLRRPQIYPLQSRMLIKRL